MKEPNGAAQGKMNRLQLTDPDLNLFRHNSSTLSVPILVLILQLVGAWEIWTHVSDGPEILGRYSITYFGAALAYHLVIAFWIWMIIWFLLNPGIRGLRPGIRVARVLCSTPWIFWLVFLMHWGGWISFILLFPTKLTFIQKISLSSTFASAYLWIFYVNFRHTRILNTIIQFFSGSEREKGSGKVLSLPRVFDFHPIHLVIGALATILTWRIAIVGGFLDDGILGTAILLFLLILVPGWLLGVALNLNRAIPGLAKIGIWFALGVGQLEILAGASRLLHLHVQYAVMGLAVMNTLLLFMMLVQKRRSLLKMKAEANVFQVEWSVVLLFCIAIVGAVWVFFLSERLAMFRYAPTRDAWNYSKTVLWFLQHPAEPLGSLRILGTVNPRVFTNGWLFANSVMAWAQPADAARLVTINLTPVLTFAGLAAISALASVLSKNNARVTLLSVVFSEFIFSTGLLLSPGWILTHRGISEFFLERVGEDKAVAFFLLLPVVLAISYKFLIENGKSLVIPLIIVLIALGFTHPMGIAGYGMCMAGFGILYLAFSFHDFHFKRWLALGIGSLILLGLAFVLDSGFLLSPAVKQTVYASSRNADISKTEVIQGVSLEDFLFDAPQVKRQFTDMTLPTIFLENRYTPMLKTSIAIAIILLLLSWKETSIQFLSGVTLITMVFLFLPPVDTLFARFISREYSWRFLFEIPIGILFAMAFQRLDRIFQGPVFRRLSIRLMSVVVPILSLVGMAILIQQTGSRIHDFRAAYLQDMPSIAAWDLLDQLDYLGDEDTLVMAPRYLNPMIIAFGKGRVFYTKGSDLSDPGVQWLERFFDQTEGPVAIEDQAYLYLLLKAFDFELLVMPRAHPSNETIFLPSENFQLVGENVEFRIYQINDSLCWPMDRTGCS